jgi:hypothetical protein
MGIKGTGPASTGRLPGVVAGVAAPVAPFNWGIMAAGWQLAISRARTTWPGSFTKVRLGMLAS